MSTAYFSQRLDYLIKIQFSLEYKMDTVKDGVNRLKARSDNEIKLCRTKNYYTSDNLDLIYDSKLTKLKFTNLSCPLKYPR